MNEKPPIPFSLVNRLKSVGYALEGVAFAIKSQHNAWLHLLAAVLVCAMGLLLQVSAADWRWLIMAIVLVWFAELINTAFEHLCDVISPEFNLSVKRAKDIAAGAVLICAMGAAIIGLLVLLPYMLP